MTWKQKVLLFCFFCTAYFTVRMSGLCNDTFTGFVFHPTGRRHWRAGLDHLMLADMAWFYFFLFECQRDSVSHTAQNSQRQKHTKQSKCVFFLMSWIILRQTVSSCHNDPSQQRSPDLIWKRENLFSSATNSELQVWLNGNWADPRLGLVNAAATRGLYCTRPASFAMP